MSRLLEELKGQTVSIRLNGFGSNWEIVDCDEDWVKLSREGIKQHRVTKLVRIEDVEVNSAIEVVDHEIKKSSERVEGA